MQVLGGKERERLLRRGGIGRAGVVADGTPAIRPVNFAFDGGHVVMRTGDSVLAEAAGRGATAQLEVDEIDPFDHTGWSVLVTGPLAEDLAEPPADAPVEPWARGHRPRVIVLTPASITGRRVGPVPVGSLVPRGGDGGGGWERSDEARRTARRPVEPLYRWWFR